MPIRYVVAVVLMIALLAVGVVGVSQFAEDSSEAHMNSETADLIQTANILYQNEELPPPGQRGAQRHLIISLPEDSLTSDPVEYFRIERLQRNVSTIEYRIEGSEKSQHQVDIPIVSGNDESMNLTGTDTEHELVLTLESDADGNRVVNIRRATNKFELVVNTEDGGKVNVGGTQHQEWQGTYQWGEEVELTAVPDEGASGSFAGWAGDVPHSARSQTISVTMNRDRNITTTFDQQALKIDVNYGSANSEVNGILVYNGSGGNPVYEVTAYKDEGYVELPQTYAGAEPGVEYTVNAYAMDMLVNQTDVSFEPGNEEIAVLDAQDYVDVTYTVKQNNNPVEGATVQVRTHEDDPNQLWRSVETNGNGNATVWLQPPVFDNKNEYYDITVLYDGEEVYSEKLHDPSEKAHRKVSIEN